MCQNITMQVNWAWIKRYCLFCSKAYNTLDSCHNFPAGSREAARVAPICETSLLSWHVSNQTCHRIIKLNNVLSLSWKVTALICQLLSLIKLFSQSLSSSTWKHYPLYEPVEPIHWSTNCIKHNFTAQLYIHAHHYRLSWGSFSDMWLNSLDPGRFGCNFKLVICKIISMG